MTLLGMGCLNSLAWEMYPAGQATQAVAPEPEGVPYVGVRGKV